MLKIMKHSKWVDFTKDFGDCVGGLFVGYGIATSLIGYGTLGLGLILISFYLRRV